MSVRITDGMMSRRLVADLRNTTSRVADAHEQVSTGKRLVRPSIDPIDSMRAVRLRADAAEAKQHQRNIDQARAWLDVTDQALSSVNDAIHRVRELTVKAGNGIYPLVDREAMATEIDQLVGLVKQAANASYNGAYVFAGQATTSVPYNANPANPDTYAGDGGPIVRTIGPGVAVQVNVPGGALFGNGTDGRLLNVLRDISAHLRSTVPADVEALRSTDLVALDRRLDDLLEARTTVGAVSERLESAKGRLQDVEDAANRFRSEAEDADMAQAIMDLTNHQSVYQAALRSGAQIIQPSLMDFLR